MDHSGPENFLIMPTATDGAGLNEQGSDVWQVVRLLVSQGCALSAMRLVRWEELRRLLGKRWQQIGIDMVRVIRREIETNLGPDDICLRYGDNGYLVISPLEGEALTALDGDFGVTIATQLVGVLGGAGMISVVSPVGIEESGLVFGQTQPTLADQTSDAHADSDENDAAFELPQSPDSQVPEPVEIDLGTGLEAATETPPAKKSRLILGDAEFSYFPLWDVRGNTIFSYLCEPYWRVNEGEIVPEEAIAEQFRNHGRVHALDLEVLHKATQELEANLDQYHLGKFLIPVHYETLVDDQTADSYTDFLGRRIWSVREFVYFEIIRPPDDIERGSLSTIAQRIKAFGNGVLLRTTAGFMSFDEVPSDDLFSIGLDLRTDSRPEPEIMEELERFADEASARNLHCHAHGLKAMSLSVAAACAGFDFIGSDAIADTLSDWQPDDYLLKPIDLFKSLIAKG